MTTASDLEGPGDPRAPKRRRYPRGEGSRLREDLVAAATSVLAESDGPEVLTLRAVARRVGVTPASIYHHFPDVDSLTEAVLTERFADLSQETEALVGHQGTARERLVARCWAYVSWGLRSPGHYRVVFGGRARAAGTLPASGDGDDLLASLRDDLAAVRHHADGVAGAADDDDQVRGVLLWTALHGIVSLLNEKSDMAWPPCSDLLSRTVALHAGLTGAEVAGAARRLPPLVAT